ncbi:MAG TPA: DNA primase [Polyangia bacterium]|nr:DNA primase [Polyangia bacterium]
MGLIPEDKIAEIRDRTDIVQVIGEQVALKRAGGANWKGLCPFHDERTPSFNVNSARQFYHCFGCRASGDVIRFKMDFEKRDFMDVLRELAQRAGVELPEPARTPEERRAAADRETERERLLRLTEAACSYYRAQLSGPRGARARAYLKSRGIGPETEERFRLGYAPEGWDNLQQHFLAQKLPLALAEKIGLVGVSERGKRYDFFRDRIMLPVIGRSGEVVGFGSRLLDPDAKDRKYVNSPESTLYHKKDQLYGLHAAREAIRKRGRVVVVEGNFDVLALHQAGLDEAVAPMGTALGPDQLGLLKRMAQTVVLLFDADAAGRKATLEAIELCARGGVEARVATLPQTGEKVDPDSFVRSRGAEVMRALIDQAPPAIEHFLDEVAAAAEPSVPGRVKAIQQVKGLLLAVDDPTARELYVRHFADRIRVEPRLVLQGLRGGIPAIMKTSTTTEKPGGAQRKTAPEEVKLIALLLAKPPLSGQAQEFDAGALFADADLARLYHMVLSQISQGQRATPSALLEAAPADLRTVLAEALLDEEPATEQAVADCLLKMQLRRLTDEAARLQKEYRAAPSRELAEKLTEVARQRDALLQKQGDRV